MRNSKPNRFTPKRDRIVLSEADRAKYLEYGERWQSGEDIPALAKEEGVENRVMHSSIAYARGVHRFSPEMRETKRLSNQIRRKRGELPLLNNKQLVPEGI